MCSGFGADMHDRYDAQIARMRVAYCVAEVGRSCRKAFPLSIAHTNTHAPVSSWDTKKNLVPRPESTGLKVCKEGCHVGFSYGRLVDS